MFRKRSHRVDRIDGERYFTLTEPWSKEAGGAFDSASHVNLELNYAKGFVGENLDFLQGLAPNLKRLIIVGGRVRGLAAALRLCSQLEHLELQIDPAEVVDFSELGALRSLSVNWSSRFQGVDFTGLRELFISRWPDADLARIVQPTPSRLTSFRMKDSRRLTDASLVAELPRLEHLELAGCRRLMGAPRLGSSVQWASFAGSSGIDNLEQLGLSESLRRLDISDLGKVASLKPLGSLSALGELYFSGSTDVRDGDLQVLLTLPQLTRCAFQDRAHYNLQRKDVKSHA